MNASEARSPRSERDWPEMTRVVGTASAVVASRTVDQSSMRMCMANEGPGAIVLQAAIAYYKTKKPETDGLTTT